MENSEIDDVTESFELFTEEVVRVVAGLRAKLATSETKVCEMQAELTKLTELSESENRVIQELATAVTLDEATAITVEDDVDDEIYPIVHLLPAPVKTPPKIPLTMSDLTPTIRDVVSPHRRSLSSGDKMTEAQAAYVSWWTESNTATGKRGEALKLMSDGIKDLIWPKGWAPGTNDMVSYLTERIKNIVKKNDRMKEKKRKYRELLRDEDQ